MTRSCASAASVRMQGRQRRFFSIVASLTIVTLIIGSCADHHSRSESLGVAPQGDTSLAPYLPDKDLAAPTAPPTFLVAAPGEPTLRPFYLDWSGASGSTKAPPDRMRWQAIAHTSATLGWLGTSQVPIRVVVYLYPRVDSNGIPIEGSGSEHRCSHSDSQQAFCTYRKVVHSGKSAIELGVRGLDTSACYVVVHASWIVRHQVTGGTVVTRDTNHDEVAASWAWRRCVTGGSHPTHYSGQGSQSC